MGVSKDTVNQRRVYLDVAASREEAWKTAKKMADLIRRNGFPFLVSVEPHGKDFMVWAYPTGENTDGLDLPDWINQK